MRGCVITVDRSSTALRRPVTATAKRHASTAVFAVAFVVLGLPDFGHGVAWPDMRSDLHRPLADLGTLLSVAAAGYLVVAMSTGRLAKRWGVEGLVLRSTLSSAAGLLAIAIAPAWPLVLAGSLLTGAGAGGMDTGFNAAVALRADGRLMGLLHAGYGVGAAIGPVVMGASLASGGGWRPGYVVFAAASLLLVIPVAAKSMGEASPQEAMGSPRGLFLPCLAFFVYVSLEVTVGQWAFTSLTQHRGLGEFAASAWVALYWIALTAGRLWLALAGHRVPVRRLLGLAVAGAAIAAVILWVGGPIAPAGLLVGGFALSVVFPLLMLLTPQRVGAERAAAAVGWQTAAASIGAAGGPAVAGVVLDSVGIEAYGPIALAMAGSLAAVVVALEVGGVAVGSQRSLER
jgi:fucose permease